MADDIDDIYSDLPNFELDKECERLQNELEDLKQKTDAFTSKIDELTKEKEKLVKQKSILLKNISILLKTARQEVQRKDEIILQLRNEIETLKKSNFPRFNPAKRNNTKKTETPLEKDIAPPEKEIPTKFLINTNVRDRLGPLKNNEEKFEEPFDSKLLRNKEKSTEERLGQKVEDCYQPNYTDSKLSRNIDKFNRDRLDSEVEHNLKRSNRNVAKSCNETDDGANSKSSKNNEGSRELVKFDKDRLSSRCDSKPYNDPVKRSHKRLNENSKSKDRGDSNSCRDKTNHDRLSHDIEYHKANDRLDFKSSKDANDGRRDRLGPEFDNYRKVDRYGVRNDSRFHRHPDRRYYDNNVRGKRKIYEDDIYDKPYRSSRSPPCHSGSRSPNRKRRRSRSRGTSSGLKEACTTSPPHKVPKEINPSPTQLEKTDFEISLNNKVTEQSFDDKKNQNIDNNIGADDPIASLAGHEEALNKSEGKEEGEMSDSDSYKDAEEDHPVNEWKPSIKRKHEEAPKTIFTLRMEQKLKREDEERKRAMIHAAANDQNHVDTTLFDKPIKINRNENPLSLSKNSKKIFEPNKEVSNIPPTTDSNLGKEIPKVAATQPDDKSEPHIVTPVDNVRKTDKSKLTLNIAQKPLELVKQSSVETYSPFKENYKLIELSPAVLSKGNSYHKNLEINKNENFTQIEENEKKTELATDSPCSSITSLNTDQPVKNDEILKKESIAEVPELVTPKFDVHKPLKPLLPSDIFGALLQPEPALPKEGLSLPLEMKECEPLLNNETKKGVDVFPPNSVTGKNSLQSYRIPKKSSIKKSNDTKDLNVQDNKKKESNKAVDDGKCVKSDRKKSIVDDRSTNINRSDHRRKDELSINQCKKINAQENTSDKVIDKGKVKKDAKVDKKEKITTKDLVEKCNVNSDPKKIGNISKEKTTKDEKAPKSSKTPLREEKDVGKVIVDDKTENISEKNKSSKPISTRRSSKDKIIKKKTEDSLKETVVPENTSELKSSNDEPEKVFSSKAETGSKDNEGNNYVLTPRNISINPIITLDIPNTDKVIDVPKLSPIIKENEKTHKKKEELMSGLNLDATPVNLLESSICEENRIVSPCPITPDIPRELLRPIQSRTNCPSQSDFKNFSEKQAENKSSNDIANFEIFKSVNINNSSSSMDNSHESKTSNRLQNDLCLSETEPDSENSSCEDSDSEASDIMEMFD